MAMVWHGNDAGPNGDVVGAIALAKGEEQSPARLGVVGGWTSSDGSAGNGGAFVDDSMLTRTPVAGVQAVTAFSIPGSASPAPLGDGTGVAGTTSPANVVETGSRDPGDGSIMAAWGRWNAGTITDGGGTYALNAGGAHFLMGNLTPPDIIASRTGVLALTPFGGTTPTNSAGQVATSHNYPAITVDFTNRVATLGTATWSFPSNIWSLPGGTAQVFIAPGQGAGIAGQYSGGFCSGTGCSGPVTLGVSGVFLGPQGDHLGAAFGAQAGGATAHGVQLYAPGGAAIIGVGQ
jgi:hypothetical protein